MNHPTSPPTRAANRGQASRAPTGHWGWRAALSVLVLASLLLRLWVSWPGPNPKRFWDERYLVANTARALSEGLTTTQNAYYPGLGHMPTAVLLELGIRLGAKRDEVLVSPRQLGTVGYRVARSTSALWGAGGVVFVFLLGRRLFASAPEAAVLWGATAAAFLAALVIALVPWHLRQSVLYKPDIALCTLVTVSLWSCLRLLEEGTFERWATAWVAAALAVSAKWNAAPLIVPLVWASVVAWQAEPRPWRRAFGALVLGTSLIVALNPTLLSDPGSYRRDLAKTATHYAGRAEQAQATHLDMPLHAVSSLASADYLGGGLAALGAVGLALAVGLAWRSRRGPLAASPWALVLVWLIAYVGTYSLATAYPSPHNWLPLLPAAVILVALGWCWSVHKAASWFGSLAAASVAVRGRVAVAAQLLLAAGLLLPRAAELWDLARSEAVPSTRQVVEQRILEAFASRGGLDGRVVLSEEPLHDRLDSFAVQSRTLDPRGPRLVQWRPAAAQAIALPAAWTDAEVWHQTRADCGGAAPRGASDASAAGGAQVVAPRLLQRRGEALCLRLHPWRLASKLPAFEAESDGQSARIPWPAEWAPSFALASVLPESGQQAGASSAQEAFEAAPALFSLDLGLARRQRGQPASAEILLEQEDGRVARLPCRVLRQTSRRVLCRTPRFPAPYFAPATRDRSLVVALSGGPRLVVVEAHQWLPPAETGATP